MHMILIYWFSCLQQKDHSKKDKTEEEQKRLKFKIQREQREQAIKIIREQIRRQKYMDMLEIRRQREENDLKIIQERQDWFDQKQKKRQIVQDKIRQSQQHVDQYWVKKLQYFKENKEKERAQNEMILKMNIDQLQKLEDKQNKIIQGLSQRQQDQQEESQKLNFVFNNSVKQYEDRYINSRGHSQK